MKNVRGSVSTGQKLKIPSTRDAKASNQETRAVKGTELMKATDPVIAPWEDGKTKPDEKSQTMATVGQKISTGDGLTRRTTAIS